MQLFETKKSMYECTTYISNGVYQLTFFSVNDLFGNEIIKFMELSTIIHEGSII